MLVKERIDQINLTLVMKKIANKTHGEGWTEERCIVAEKEYKKFLYLNFKYRDKNAIVPLPDVDIVWHNHILDTKKYREDCEEALGFFLDHYPYLGIRYEGDKINLEKANNISMELYHREYGRYPNASFTSEVPPACSGSYPPPGSPPPPPPSPTCAGSYPPPP
jgi:hypothetical protein